MEDLQNMFASTLTAYMELTITLIVCPVACDESCKQK